MLLAAAAAGAATTLLQLEWLRAVAASLPGAVPAAALVVPGMLVAWSAGALVAGRLADRRGSCALVARWLAAAGLLVLLAPAALAALVGEAPPSGALWRGLSGALPVVPASLALAGAWPLFVRLLCDRGFPAARATASAAAATGAGGLLGAALCVPTLLDGRSPLTLAAALLVAAGALLWLLAARPAPLAATASEVDGGEARRLLPLAIGAAGFVLVAGELALLRLVVQTRGDSLATTAEALGALFAGMGLGAACLAALPRRVSASTATATLLVLAGLALALLPRLHLRLAAAPPWLGALALLGPLGATAGACVTAAARAGSLRHAASRVGGLAALSTLGGVLGALLYARVLAPAPQIGTPGALRLLALLSCVAALALGLAARRKVLAGVAALVALGSLLLPALELPWRSEQDEVGLLARREGAHGVLSLVRLADGGTRLKTDGRFGVGGTAGALLERRLGRIAAALQPEAQRALLLGLGAGHTLAGLAASTPAAVECVEIDAEILALGLPVPYEPGSGPRGGTPSILRADARAHLLGARGRYDLIVGDLFFPWVTGAGGLFDREHFAALRGALSEHGVAVQWLPLHQLPWPAFGSVARAFLESFPTARLLVAQPLANQPLVALVGGLDAGLPRRDDVDALLEAHRSAGGPHGYADLLDVCVCDSWALQQRFRSSPVASHAGPWSELLSLRREGDEAFLARTNLGLLADLVEPLATIDLASRPPREQDERLLGVELTARAAALQALLLARAGLLRLADPEAGTLLPDERAAVGREIDLALLRGWQAFPGHRDLRVVLVERAQALTKSGRDEAAADLLRAAHAQHADPGLDTALAATLLLLGRDDEALALLVAARGALPDDRTLLLHLGAAQVRLRQDGEALATLARARELSEGRVLPPLHAVVLALLECEPGARDAAREVLLQLDAEDPWGPSLVRLLDAP